MIIIDGNQIKIGEVEERVSKWEVWFHTPFGLCKDIYEAVEVCKKAELDPEACIVPIPVAVGPTIYEAFHRG